MKRKKTGGRAKGTPNRVTAVLKERISNFLDENFDNVVVEINQLEGKDKVQAYLKLIEFVVPKQKFVEKQVTKAAIDYSQFTIDELSERLDATVKLRMLEAQSDKVNN